MNSSRQTSVNDVYQKSDQICSASCTNIQSGNVIFIDGTTTGDIQFVQECEANAGCMMNNAVDSVMELLQDAKQKGELQASIFPNFGSISLNLSDQEIRTQVEQALNTVCSANIENQQTDNMIYARNSTTGDIGFRQNGNARANCVMTNSATARLNLQQKGDQQSTIGGIGFGGILGLAIVLIIIFAILGALGARKKGGGGGGGFGGGGGYGGGGGGGGQSQMAASMSQQYGGGSSGGGSAPKGGGGKK